MERDPADILAFRLYARRRFLRFALGVPLTWATIFVLYIVPMGTILVSYSHTLPPFAFDIVFYPGLFLATSVTGVLSAEEFVETVHEILWFRNLQVHFARGHLLGRPSHEARHSHPSLHEGRPRNPYASLK